MENNIFDVFESKTEQAIRENGENGENGGDTGVLTPIYKDSKTGRFLPGSPGGPGRPPKARESAVLDLMRTSIEPAKIVQTIMELVEDSGSWRARAKGVELYLNYVIGMPVQRSVTASTKLEAILNRLGDMSDDEFANVEQAMRQRE